MTAIVETLPFFTQTGGEYQFSATTLGDPLTIPLRVQCGETAKRLAVVLYVLSKELERDGKSHSEIADRLTAEADRMYEEELLASVGIGRDALSPAVPLAETAGAKPGAVASSGLSFAEVLLEAVEDVAKNGGEEYRRKCLEAGTEFAELNPGITFQEIQYAHAKTHRDALQRLPNRRTLRKEYRDVSIKDVLAIEVPAAERMSAKTINQRMDRLAALWDWAEDEGACSGRNPFRRSRLSLKETPIVRGRFTMADINTIFTSSLYRCPEYRSGPGASRSWWWMFPLALYSGARIGEIVQLTTDDVKLVDGVLVLVINDEGEKSLKTTSSRRLVPVHPELLQLGFKDYVRELRKRGIRHVLPHPSTGKTPAPKTASKFYRRYRAVHLPPQWEREHKVLHSARHTFLHRAIIGQGLDLPKVQRLAGHEPVWMGETRRYSGNAYPVKALYEVMSAFSYEGVKLDHLRGGWEALPLD